MTAVTMQLCIFLRFWPNYRKIANFCIWPNWHIPRVVGICAGTVVVRWTAVVVGSAVLRLNGAGIGGGTAKIVVIGSVVAGVVGAAKYAAITSKYPSLDLFDPIPLYFRYGNSIIPD